MPEFSIQGFFESYGWYIVFGVAASAFFYLKLVSPALNEYLANKRLVDQKKFDSRINDAYGDNVKKARERLQEKVNAEAERKREKAEWEREQKIIEAKNAQDETEGKLGGSNDVEILINKAINKNKIVIFSKTYCPFCKKAKNVLAQYEPQFVAIELDEHPRGEAIQYNLHKITGIRTVPQVFINGKFIGGGDDTVVAHQSGKIASLL
ncbi:hypothetical protein L596_024834 [Steinernema carpocapsae]|uniref:Glutaredoxin-2, mitochondrial n=1 Tax=Steinernema carpocapsae TaxID=34508 RepID=A0A4U5M5Y5_STECR|nr:hypothetical protein L596_024834 [Steinernema carpocapsae]